MTARADTDRLPIVKTFKLYVDGKFPRSESGRSSPVFAGGAVPVAYASHASRKDLREAVEAARRAQPGWAGATAFLRGQILYRIAEMMEGKREELAGWLRTSARADSKLPDKADAAGEVSAAIDRVIAYAGWADKYAQVLGCNNAVAGPHYNFTSPEPTGVVAAVAPDERPLLALVSLAAPALAAGNTVVACVSPACPLPGLVLAEACATGDVPAGVLNIIASPHEELVKFLAPHRDIDAIHTANIPVVLASQHRAGAAENVKRVTVRRVRDWFDPAECEHPWWIEPLVEFKTVWHPSAM